MKLKKRVNFASLARRTAALFAGSIIFAASVNMFLLPAGIVQGGVTGIASALNIKFGTSVGLVIILINIPLIIASAWVNGFKFIAATATGVFFTSLATDLVTFLPVTVLDPFLCSVIGGALMGLACGILFANGFTTGGTDLIAILIRKRLKRLPIGKLILAVDAVIIVGAAFLLENYMSIFYSALTVYVQTLVLDMFMSGTDRTRLFIIITERSDKICACLHDLGRGVTLLPGKGSYTGKDKSVILCAVTPREVFNARTAVAAADPDAFTVIADCSRTYGEGFGYDSIT